MEKLHDMKPTSIVKRLEAVMREQWDCDALTDYRTDVTYKYGDVAMRICYLHMLFESLGIKPGDKVAVCDKNSSNWVIAMLAVLSYRTVAVPLLPDYSKEQLRTLCEHCGAKFMIASHRLANLWPEGQCPMYMIDVEDLLAMTPSILTDEVEDKAYALFAQRYPNGFTKEHVHYEAENPDDLMILSYTSGSTGNPKGVMLPWRSLQSNMQFAKGAFPCESGQRLLLILPLAHMYGYALDFLHGILKGAHLFILTQRPVPQIVLKAFDEIKPAYLLSVPLILEKVFNIRALPILQKPFVKVIMNVPIVSRLMCRMIRRQLMNALGGNIYEVMMGGAALNKEIEKILHKIKFPFTIGYGMTECGPMITYSDWKEHRLGSCGKAVVNMEVKVISNDPQHEPGEIVTKGINTMLGYYKNADATAATIDEDGWLHTGDLGTIDKDGFIYVRGRKKNMLLGSNGQNIYPEEAEEQVVSYSIFEECVVVQRQKKLVGLVYVSDAVLKKVEKKREELDLEAIRKEVNLHLPSYCQLSMLEQRTEEFQKTPKKSIRRYLYQ
jgi:long-chain acyl-CoA synthetase